MKKEKYELSSQYMKDLKKLLKAKKSTPYDIAHASFRKKCAHWIIKNFDKRSLEITYLNGDTKHFLNYNDLMKEIETVNKEYKSSRKKHIKRYYDVIHRFTEHRRKIRERKIARNDKRNTLANALCPEQVKALASQI
tara:strand:+ start:4345 stop:4755 length:411 start_codon:yes stop_codon:yes gene_type:complete